MLTRRLMLPFVGSVVALAITAGGGSGNESTRITTSEIQVLSSAVKGQLAGLATWCASRRVQIPVRIGLSRVARSAVPS